MSQAILETRQLKKSFQGSPLWDGLSFSLLAGERLGVAGPSGSGKSTLFRVLVGLDDVESGEIEWAGLPIKQWSLPKLRAEFMLVPQFPQFLEGTVEERITAPFRYKNHQSRRFDRTQLLEWLEEARRSESFLAKNVTELSGGERQLVALMRALLLEPRVLLLDEPTSSMDPATTALAESLILSWQQSSPNRALVLTSHQPDQMQRIASRTLSLSQA